jgi:hypothetical protein
MKVALCIPCHGDTKADFTFCLARLIAATLNAGRGIEVETLIARSSILVQSRTSLFEWSRDWGADFILWLDSDQTFPPWALLKLLERELPVVGANYRRRHQNVIPSAVKRGATGEWELVPTTPEKAAADLVEEVDRLGFGLLLTSLPTLLETFGENPYPLFETHSLPDGTFVGEDVLFCDRLRAAGVKIHVDHLTSIWVGHIQEQNLMFPQRPGATIAP